MEWYEATLFLLGAVLALMLIGLPVAIAFIGANILGAIYFMGGYGALELQASRGIGQLVNNAFPSLTTFNLIPVPMFLLMGELFFFGGLANRMFGAVEVLMGRVPGRLSYVTVAGGTAFATLSGSSMGSTALLGSLMVPEMSRRGYKKHMSIGPILGTGGLAMLIPPSALAVLLGTLAQLDIGKLLIGGIMPGVILAAMYVALIWFQCRI
ncbi:MAG: TRAP transporter large permease subunit, partial [Alphaproteobacteria bacterium]|nr:TRAP transporter large permease subunit [Alphaproteobacteria bacterium]